MLALTAGELHLMRGELDQSLPGTAVILSRTATQDGQGGETWTYAASGTVDARLSPAGLQGFEGEAAGRLAELGSWVLTLPAATTVTETDRVTYDTVTYEVTEVLTRVPWEISRRCRVKEFD